jgi:AcrR family transcriptional regulator
MTASRRKVKPRRYESAVRAQGAERTRQDIIDAARELFIDRGYAAMTMQAVADRAGVAVDTIYAAVGRKPGLIRLLVETAISNTDTAVPAEEREYVQRIRAAATARAKLTVYATAIVAIHGRLAPLVRAVEATSHAYPEVALVWREIAARRAENMRKLAAELIRTGELRPDLSIERVADVLWAMNSPELFTLFVHQRGWAPEVFGEWLADAWIRLLL